MVRKVILFALIVGAFLLSSCVGDGELKIRNRSTTDATVTINYLDERVIRADEDYSRFYSSDTNVHVEYDGLYIFKGYTDRYIEQGMISVLTLVSNGGALLIVNSSPRTIRNVYIASSDDATWGSDDLSGDIAPGESVSWTVTQGFWDIKIVNNLNEEFTYYNKQILKDSTYTIVHNGRSEDTKLKLPGILSPEGGKIEQNPETMVR